MAGDGFDVRPETVAAASTALRDDAERVRLAAAGAANTLLAAAAASGTGPLAEALEHLRADVVRVLGAAGAEIAANAERVLAAGSDYGTGDTTAAYAIGRT